MKKARDRGRTKKASSRQNGSRRQSKVVDPKTPKAESTPDLPGATPLVGEVFFTSGAEYRIERELGKGGRGQTFLAVVSARGAKASPEVPPLGTPVVIKVCKIEEERGADETLNFIDYVDKKLVEEYRALAKLRGLKQVAQVIDNGTYRRTLFVGEQVQPRFLVQQYVNGKVLAEAYGSPDSFAGVMNAKNWFDLAIAIAEALLAVHQRGVVHNDIWHKNIMLDQDGQPVFIDFGEAIFRRAHRLAFIDQPDRNDPWIAPEWNLTHIRPSRRADIFGVGGVLFWLACGSQPPMAEPDRERSKLDIEATIKDRNPGLLEQNLLIADAIARCRRYDRKERISDAESLRRELITYGRPMTLTEPGHTALHIVEDATVLSAGNRHPFRTRWADIILRRAKRQLEDIRSGLIEINGSHEELVSGCVDAFASLKEGDEYLAISSLKFWKPGNIGIRGRFFSMTHLCAQRGVKIRRVFLLTEADQKDEHFLSIMKAQNELQTANSALGNDCLETRFLLLRQNVFDARMVRGDHCGYLISGNEVMDMVPVYDDQEVLRSVRLIVSDVAPEMARRNFNQDFTRATPLTRSALTGDLWPTPASLSGTQAGN